MEGKKVSLAEQIARRQWQKLHGVHHPWYIPDAQVAWEYYLKAWETALAPMTDEQVKELYGESGN